MEPQEGHFVTLTFGAAWTFIFSHGLTIQTIPLTRETRFRVQSTYLRLCARLILKYTIAIEIDINKS